MASSLKFEAGTTTHVTLFDVNGTATTQVTLTSSTAAVHYLVADGAALADNTYLTISYSNASPVASWNGGTGCVDGGNNSGWFVDWIPKIIFF